MDEELTLEQERFCRNYTQNDSFFGNATLSYAEAYNYDLENQPRDDARYEISIKNGIEEKGKMLEKSSYDKMYDQCSALGSRLRSKDKIQKKCRELLSEFMTDEVIDSRLLEIALRGEDKDSIQAIREYNKLKQRIIEKTDITSKGERIMIMPSELIEKNATDTEPK